MVFRVAHWNDGNRNPSIYIKLQEFDCELMENLIILESLNRKWRMVFTTWTFPEDIAAREIFMSRASSLFSPESTRASWHPGKKDSGPEVVPWGWAESSSQVAGGQGQAGWPPHNSWGSLRGVCCTHVISLNP